MKTSQERIELLEAHLEDIKDYLNVEKKFNKLFPGAIDTLVKHFNSDAVFDYEYMYILNFHRSNTFAIQNNILMVEFPYQSLYWDPVRKFWYSENESDDENERKDYF